MKRLNYILCISLSLFILLNIFSLYSFADDNNLGLSATSAILMDIDSGSILYYKNSTEKQDPSGLTKTLTALITLEKSNLNDKVTVNSEAITSVPSEYSSDLLKMGEELTVKDLLYAMLLNSSNEAANALAIHVAGSIDNFTALMNNKAINLGCKYTHFVNATGIHDDNNYTTAHDLALITREAMQNENFLKIISTAAYTLPSSNNYSRVDRNFVTSNELIKTKSQYYYEYATGVQSSYSKEAKHNLIASAKKDNKNLIAIILKDNSNQSKYSDAKILLNYGFDNFSKKDIIKTGEIVSTIEIKNATSSTKKLDLVAKSGINTIVTNDKLNYKITPEIKIKDNLKAPIKAGTTVGQAIYTINNINYTIDLTAKTSVKKNYFVHFTIFIAFLFLIYIVFLDKNSAKLQVNNRMNNVRKNRDRNN